MSVLEELIRAVGTLENRVLVAGVCRLSPTRRKIEHREPYGDELLGLDVVGLDQLIIDLLDDLPSDEDLEVLTVSDIIILYGD